MDISLKDEILLQCLVQYPKIFQNITSSLPIPEELLNTIDTSDR